MDTIQRSVYPHLLSHIGENKVILLYGTRRVGKTFLLRSIAKAYSETSLFLNAEDHEVQAILSRQTFESYSRLIGEANLLILDEAQEIETVGKHLKFMIDSFPELTVFASGSSSFDLKNVSGEPLTGRSYQYELYPVGYTEMENTFGHLHAQQRIDSALIYGSYPEVLNLADDKKRQRYLKELVSNYLLKDILLLDNVQNSSKIFDLLRLLAYQCGSEVSNSELGRSLGMSKNTVERYLDLLTKVFVIFKVGGYSSNLRKEVVRSSKWYFFDNGIRNALISDFQPVEIRNDKGQLWENYCFAEKRKHASNSLNDASYYFWRTYDQQEVDMIEVSESELKAYEFKWQLAKRARPPAYFSSQYPGAGYKAISRTNFIDLLD